jgi:hypothetical protein
MATPTFFAILIALPAKRHPLLDFYVFYAASTFFFGLQRGLGVFVLL